MLRDDLCSVLKKIPEHDLTKVVLVLRYGASVTVDVIARLEEDYIVLRGRENGTNDEGRGFFIPFEDILFVRLDRIVTVAELKAFYGEKTIALDKPSDDPEAVPTVKVAAIPAAAPAPAMDPAGIAKQNLLARIRAVRAGNGAPVGS
jgi:hypothetical protein